VTFIPQSDPTWDEKRLRSDRLLPTAQNYSMEDVNMHSGSCGCGRELTSPHVSQHTGSAFSPPGSNRTSMTLPT
jgi:hypothetical protein